MPKDFHVGFDCDGVLRNLHETAFDYFFKEYPNLKKHFKDPPTPTSWGFKSSMKTFDPEVWETFNSFVFGEVESSYKVFRNAKSYPETSDFSRYYKMIKKAGGIVSICTTQKESWHKIATLQWLENSDVVFDNVILAEGKKGKFGLDYHIDDKWENITAVEGSDGVGFLLKRPWNKNSRNRVKRKVDSIESYVREVLNKEIK